MNEGSTTARRGRLVSGLVRPTLSVMDQGFAALVGFAVSVYVGRMLGMEALGLYAITYVALLVVHGFQNSLVLQAMSVLGPAEPTERRSAYFGFVFWYDRGGVLLLTGIGAAAFAIRLGLDGDHQLAAAMLAAMLYANFITLQNLLRRRFYVDNASLPAMAQSVAYLFLVVTGLFVLQRFGTPSVPSVYIVLAASSLVICAVQLPRWRGGFGWPGMATARKYAAQHWRFGKWILPSIPVVIGTYQGYYLLGSYLLTAEEVGMLKAVDSLILPFEQVAIGLSMLLLPQTSRRIGSWSVAEQQRHALRMVGLYLGLSVAYAAVVLVAGEWALTAIFSESVRGAVHLIPIIVLLPLLHAFGFPANIMIMSVKRPEINFASRVVATVVTLTLGVWVMERYGVFGAAIGLVLSVAVVTGGFWFGLVRTWRRQSD